MCRTTTAGSSCGVISTRPRKPLIPTVGGRGGNQRADNDGVSAVETPGLGFREQSPQISASKWQPPTQPCLLKGANVQAPAAWPSLTTLFSSRNTPRTPLASDDNPPAPGSLLDGDIQPGFGGSNPTTSCGGAGGRNACFFEGQRFRAARSFPGGVGEAP